MIDLDRLYRNGEDAWNYNEIFIRIANETLQNKNLRQNYLDTNMAIQVANERIDLMRKEGRNPEAFVILRDELIRLRDNILARIGKGGTVD